MRDLSTYLIWLATLLILVFLAHLILLFTGYIPYTITEMAQFGDMFGGILNPFLTLINIAVFIKLTMEVTHLTNRTTSSIATINFKNSNLKELRAEIFSILSQWKEEGYPNSSFLSLYHCFFNIKYVFDDEIKASKYYYKTADMLMNVRMDFSKYSREAMDAKYSDIEGRFTIFFNELHTLVNKTKD